MSLLKEIQAAAIDANIDICVVLRKCKVLAKRLGSAEFDSWVEHELNGYSAKEDLPRYRMIPVQSRGDFVGMFGSELRNAPIPPLCLPEEIRDVATKQYLLEPISHFVSLVGKGSGDPTLRCDWPADVIALYGDKVYQHMRCLAAWRVLSRNSFSAVLDTVRNRVLSFVLEIETEAPDAGEAAPDTNPLPEKRVNQVFNTYIYGNAGNVAAGSKDVIQNADVSVTQNDVESLLAYLEAARIPADDLQELRVAIDTDGGNAGKAWGSNVSAWFAKMINKAASGAWNVGTTVAANLLAKALSRYYGLE